MLGLKISQSQIGKLLQAYRDKQVEGGDRATDGSEAAVKGHVDRVKLSTQAEEAQRIMKQLKEMPDVRGERVAALSQAIKEGSYNVSGEDIAEKILQRVLAGEDNVD